jgi:hypothetical protein
MKTFLSFLLFGSSDCRCSLSTSSNRLPFDSLVSLTLTSLFRENFSESFILVLYFFYFLIFFAALSLIELNSLCAKTMCLNKNLENLKYRSIIFAAIEMSLRLS